MEDVHPGSWRRTLDLSAHASHIVGWLIAEGDDANSRDLRRVTMLDVSSTLDEAA